jgi:hypothetical protein
VEKKALPPSKREKATDDTLAPVSIPYGERALGIMAKTMGCRWDPDVKLWYIPAGKVKGTELEKHLVLDAKMKRSARKSLYY